MQGQVKCSPPGLTESMCSSVLNELYDLNEFIMTGRKWCFLISKWSDTFWREEKNLQCLLIKKAIWGIVEPLVNNHFVLLALMLSAMVAWPVSATVGRSQNLWWRPLTRYTDNVVEAPLDISPFSSSLWVFHMNVLAIHTFPLWSKNFIASTSFLLVCVLSCRDGKKDFFLFFFFFFQGDLVAAGVLSGNRNFEGRVHPNVQANYLASPPLVIAYAIAGTVRIDFDKEPLGQYLHFRLHVQVHCAWYLLNQTHQCSWTISRVPLLMTDSSCSTELITNRHELNLLIHHHLQPLMLKARRSSCGTSGPPGRRRRPSRKHLSSRQCLKRFMIRSRYCERQRHWDD